jgi:histidinol-phosphate/aromatic aminotransferase/cobyric acid decarboxylase-like protein
VLIDEAYHHYVEHPDYATSMPYVTDGRQVIVTRTFSKVYGLAGMRLGYAVAPKALIDRMRPHCTGSINALVKWAGGAALRDTAAAERVRETTLRLRKKTSAELGRLGYTVLPSDANFFMVHIRRDVVPVIEAFRWRSVLVGRPFPPMVEHLRVSVGTPTMDRFLAGFRRSWESRSIHDWRQRTLPSGRWAMWAGARHRRRVADRCQRTRKGRKWRGWCSRGSKATAGPR